MPRRNDTLYVVYAISDLKGAIRYVGASCRGYSRPLEIMRYSKLRSRKLSRDFAKFLRSIRKLSALERRRLISFLEVVENPSDLYKREEYWIKRCASDGAPLFNRWHNGYQNTGCPKGVRMRHKKRKKPFCSSTNSSTCIDSTISHT